MALSLDLTEAARALASQIAAKLSRSLSVGTLSINIKVDPADVLRELMQELSSQLPSLMSDVAEVAFARFKALMQGSDPSTDLIVAINGATTAIRALTEAWIKRKGVGGFMVHTGTTFAKVPGIRITIQGGRILASWDYSTAENTRRFIEGTAHQPARAANEVLWQIYQEELGRAL